MPKTLKPIQFFKPGTFTSQSGRSIEFTEAMLKDAQDAYDPALYQAPLVAGHPKTDAPNYGLVAGLSYSDGHLYAITENVDESFADLVAAKRFNTVSGSWYLPDMATNPKPGHLYLKHLGFLGAVPPALKGLKSPEAFTEEEDGCVVCYAELGPWETRTLGDILRGLREWVIGKFGLEEADRALPGWSVDQITDQAAQPTLPDDANAMYAEASSADPLAPAVPAGTSLDPVPAPAADASPVPSAEDPLAGQKAALEAQALALATREEAIRQKEADLKREGLAAFADQLVQEGKLLPSEKGFMVAFAMSLSPDLAVEFSEGEGDPPVQMPGLDSLKAFFSKRPAVVTFSEVAKPPTGDPSPTSSFVAPPGSRIDPAAAELHQKATAYAEQHGCSFSEAFEAIGGK